MSTNERTSTAGSRGAVRPALLLALGLALGLWCGVGFDRVALVDRAPAKLEHEFRLIAQAWGLIERHYVDRSALKPTEMTYGAISGLVDSLGDYGHSTFLSPKMLEELKQSQEGKLQGIGVEIQMKGDRVVVVAPLDGSPAQRADLRPGDAILKVNGADIDGLSVSQVVARITGKPGTRSA